MSRRRSKFEGLFEASDNQSEQPIQEQAENTLPPVRKAAEESLKPRNQEIKISRNKEQAAVVAPRVKTNYEIRQDYVRAMKRIAVDDGRKIYEVLEDAIGQYLEQHRQRNP